MGLRRAGRALVCATAVVVCALSGCLADEEDLLVDEERQALGEPRNGFPSWAERVQHVWINRARAAPAAAFDECSRYVRDWTNGQFRDDQRCYPAQPPVGWEHDLARAARFHSDSLAQSGCDMYSYGPSLHYSPCDLVSNISDRYDPGSCDGRPGCACRAGTLSCSSAGTRSFDRMDLFTGGGYNSENVAYFPNGYMPSADAAPVRGFYELLCEPDSAANPSCEKTSYNGHRHTLMSERYTGVGVGESARGGEYFYTQDFVDDVPFDGLVGGVHYPRRGPNVAFRANWYGDQPVAARVVVDGRCRDMTVERGNRRNGTFIHEATSVSGCQTYYFHFHDGRDDHFFPSTGAFGINCSFDWTGTRSAPCGMTRRGNDGNNTIRGGAGGDTLSGLGGDDVLRGAGGADRLYGGAGADQVHGEGGNDRIWGGDGNDRLWGERGNDRITGGRGNDRIWCGGGADHAWGEGGDDEIHGGDGADRLGGGGGHDHIWGDGGNDIIWGGDQGDTLSGGPGNDEIYGQQGWDTLYGGWGADRLDGGAGGDTLDGGGGADTFVYGSGYGRDRIVLFENDVDTLRLDDALWSGSLTARQVVDRFASLSGGNVVLDFGGGNVLTIAGLDGRNQLRNDVVIY